MIEATEAEISRLETLERTLEERLRLTTIVSPASGVVTTPHFEERIGLRVNKGDILATIVELDRPRPELLISEKEIADVHPGQSVVLRARAYPERKFSGTVKAIAPAATDDTGLVRKVFRVTVEIDAPSDILKPEMTGTAKVYAGTRPIWNLLTRRIAHYLRVEFWSWW